MATAAFNAVIKTPGISTTFSTSETFSNVSGTIYQIDDTDKRVWDRDIAPTVYLDGIVSTPSAVDYLFGKVTVSTAGTVTVSGNYLPMSEKTSFNSYTLSLSGDVLDKTTFDNNGAGYKRRQQGLLDASLTLAGFQNPWFYDFTDTTADLEVAIAITGDASTLTITAGSGSTVGDLIRIDDEIFRVSSITAASTSQDTVIATRAQWGSAEAAHSTGIAVFLMNYSIFTRNAVLVEIQPAGSSDDIWRIWTKAESMEDSGTIGDLVQNSISLQLDESQGAAIGRNTV
ncbi:MAG: hypothetical protein PHC43_01150 [Candidatus Marinimicrobia bacterium]|nr:hypothetical protein [Candidatus Neomarinimicrobiota bacterium]